MKKHKKLAVAGSIILLIIIGGASGDHKPSTTAGNSKIKKTAKVAAAGQLPKIGAPVRDGKFEFKVRSIECGHPNVGADYLTKNAQGQYCLLNITVKNIGSEAQSLFSANQKLWDASNKKYSADDEATFDAAPQGSSAWYSDINPGNSVKGVIVFDVPKGVAPVIAELHDSAYSGGIKIKLEKTP